MNSKETSKLTGILVLAGILINVIGKCFAEAVSAPFWLDSVGTCLVAYLSGPWIGMACGILSNIGYSIIDKIALPYTITSAAIGITVGVCARKNIMKDVYGIITTSFIVGIISVIISSPLNLLFYDGRCGNVWGDGLYDLLADNNVATSVRAVLAEAFIDIPDKIISLLFVCLFVRLIRKNKGAENLRNMAIPFIVSVFACSGMWFTTEAEANIINGGDYVPIVYNSENKMSSSEANDIVQTPDGYIWVGSYAGLYRYDGQQFTMVGKRQNISNVTVLYVDSKGRLFVGTNDSGVAVYENNKFKLYGIEEGLDVNSIRSICEGESGEIYIGTTGKTAILHPDGTIVQPEGMEEVSYVNSLTDEKDGLISGVTNDGILFFVQNEKVVYKETFKSEQGGYYTCVYRTGAGEYLAGTSNKQIVQFSGRSGKIQKERNIHLTGINALRSITEDANGQIWICAEDGFGYMKDGAGFVPVSIPMFNNSLENMVQDYEGNYWFASSRLGVLELTKNMFADVFAKAGLSDRVVNATCVYDGLLYVATDTGLVIVDEKNNKEIRNAVTKHLDGVRVRSLMKDSSANLWVSTYGEDGLVCLTKQGQIVTYNEENSGTMGSRFRSAIEMSDGTVVAASSTGLSFIRDGKVTATVGEADGLTNPQILCMYEMPDGRLLAGSDGDGIFILDGTEIVDCISYDNGLPSQIILRICEFKGGYLLVTSNSLCSMDGSGNVRQLQNFPYANNLDAKIDQNGNVWVLSSAGIFVVSSDSLYNDSTEMSYRLYGPTHGLFTSLTANSWNYMDENGRIYLSCANGVKTVETLAEKAKQTEYKLALNKISGEEGEILPSENDIYQMSKGDKRIEVEPVVLNYTLSSPYVKYYLEGVDEHPIVAHSDAVDVIRYTNIPSGTYEFHFAVLDETTMQPLNEMVITLNKEKQFYEHVWFYAYLIFVILAVVAFVTWTLTRISSMEVIRSQYEQIRLAKDEADRANSAKSMFLANMSHEIRTPMNAVIGMSEIALKEDVSDTVRENLVDILGASRKLLGTINDILDFSKIESGKMEIVDAEYSLHAMIRGVVNIISFRLEQKPIRLVVDVEDGIPDRLYGDELRIRQVLINLLNNAVKFTEKGTITLSVRGNNTEYGIELIMSVEDTGCGIKKEDRERLFESFERVENQGLHKIEGTGLGLAISKNMVELMNGNISLDSEYGKGTTFHVTIPQKVMEGSVTYAEAVLAQKEEESSRAESENWTFAGARILVVDDDAVNLKVAKGLMKDYDLEIDLAESGNQCIEMTRETTYDMIFLDHLMPQMDGIETLHKLKEDASFVTPVVMVTANALVGVEQMYMEAGFSDYLSKPMEQKEIFRVLSLFLEDKMKKRHAKDDSHKKKSSVDSAVPVSSKHMEKVQAEAEPSDVSVDRKGMSPFLARLEAEGIHTGEAMRFMGNDEEQSTEILQMFVEDSGKKKEKLSSFLLEENWKEYGILVHALKSNMRSLGADRLADMAFALEKAAKASDGAFVKEKHEAFVLEWQLLVTGLKYIPRLGFIKSELAQMEQKTTELPMDGAGENSEFSDEQFRKITEEIAGLIDDFETEQAKEKLEQLSGRAMNLVQKDTIARAEKALKDYDYDTAVSILSE